MKITLELDHSEVAVLTQFGQSRGLDPNQVARLALVMGILGYIYPMVWQDGEGGRRPDEGQARLNQWVDKILGMMDFGEGDGAWK